MPDEFCDLARRVNNWGRWGADDEIGTLNLISNEVVARAAACVRTGRTFSLALPLSIDGPQTGAVPGRVNPIKTMIAVNAPLTGDPAGVSFNDDVVFMGLQAATHWDALCHATYDGRMYNGFPVSSVTARGASRCGIDKVRSLVSRGVLLDVARAKGVERLEPGTPITPSDLDDAERLARTKVASGDVVLIRTGHMRLFRSGDRRAYAGACPGPEMACAAWFRDRDIAAVAIDTLAFEVFPPERADCFLPLHLLDLVEMGLTQGQNFDVEDLAADCASDGVYECFLEATPEPFAGGAGGPVVPIAVK